MEKVIQLVYSVNGILFALSDGGRIFWKNVGDPTIDWKEMSTPVSHASTLPAHNASNEKPYQY